MSEEEGKDRGLAASSYPPNEQEQPPSQAYYGTFQGVANYPPPPPPQQPTIGFPQPVPPPGTFAQPQTPSQYFAHAYQTVTGYAIAEGLPLRRERRLPCCGIGIGWFLFIIGFFFAGIPWYLGALFILCSTRIDYREKPGYVSCTIAAVLVTIAIIFGATSHDWDWD